MKELYAVYDKLAETIGNIMTVANDVAAIRTFSDVCNNDDPNNYVAKHIEDYELWHLGTLINNGVAGETILPPDARPQEMTALRLNTRVVCTGQDILNARKPKLEAAK